MKSKIFDSVTKALLCTALIGLSSADVRAATVFDGGAKFWLGGSCLFNTFCANTEGYTDFFAAQRFTLTSSAQILSGSMGLVSNNNGVKLPTAVNWKILSVNKATGLPGAVITSGTNATAGSVQVEKSYAQTGHIQYFDMGSISLDAGSYYVAIQAVSPIFSNYLIGGAETYTQTAASYFDGRWHAGYANVQSIAVSLYDVPAFGTAPPVPEPQTCAMLIAGLGLVGFAARRKRNTA